MKISGLLRREKTNAIVKQTVTFNAPGTYYPPYGKTNFSLQGKSTAGNPTTTNPTNSNPAVPGNAIPGNPVPVAGYFVLQGYTFVTVYQIVSDWTASTYPGRGGYNYVYWAGAPQESSYYTSDGAGTWNMVTYFTGGTSSENVPYGYYVPGFSYVNATNYNPATAGNTVPGNTVPGNAGPSYNVLGVPLPGGAANTAAPVVNAPVSIDYTTGGTSISVPPGGYVSIINA
jgi:hypothetical protein